MRAGSSYALNEAYKYAADLLAQQQYFKRFFED
jgi:hypothetical protein